MVTRLDFDERNLVAHHEQLLAKHRPAFHRLDKYYEGSHRLQQLQLAIPTELEQFVVFVNWCRKVVDAIENRLTVLGFRLPGTTSGDNSTQEAWDYNKMGVEITQGFIDALALSISYITVSTNEEDVEFPLIHVESPTEMSHITDQRKRRLSSLFRSYNPVDGRDTSATLYLPDETYWLERDGFNDWYIGDYDAHGIGRVPGVAMINRPRTHDIADMKTPGRSQMTDIIPIVDAAARALTNAQVAQETHAVPQRGVLGVTKGDFTDEQGNPIPAWEAYFGAVWALGNKDAKTFQFDSSDMKNFETIVNLYARQASGVSGLPANYFGLAADDAASDAAIRSRETQVVKFAEREQENFGGDIRDVAQIVDRFKTGDWDPDLRKLEVVWQDAGTPTRGQLVDAAVKLKEQDVFTREDVWEEMNLSPARIELLRERFEKRDELLMQGGVNDLLRQVGVDENGVPSNGNAGNVDTGAVRASA